MRTALTFVVMQFLNSKPGLRSLLPAILTPLLLWAAWPSAGFVPLLLTGLVPLLFLEDYVSKKKKERTDINLFRPVYISFLLFNLLTTWWVWYASPFGMFGAVFANSLLMSLPFMLFHHTRRILGNGIGYASLVIYWVTFEHLHMNWDLSWPWLNLGNGFASWADMVQWYEYTGTQGGTIWIWICNIFIYFVLTNQEKRKANTLVLGSVILIPLTISYLILHSYKEAEHPVEVVAIQPNIDPYNEKFSGNSDEQLSKILRLASPLISPKTDLVVCPETALPDGIWNNEVNDHPQLQTIRSFILPHNRIRFLTGLNYYRYYLPTETPSETARLYPDRKNEFYDVYNAAIQIQNGEPAQFHFKSKLVPGVEKMPFPALFGHLESFAIDLGGITGSLGVQDTPSVFTGDGIVAAPVICYESIYGEYLGEYVRKGANLICIMTNDGWWRDTPGYRQHCQYARLRAIEHRRSIVRSANTGISCFISQTGEISQATSWWVPAAIKADLNLNNQTTVYSRLGDYPGEISIWLTGGLILALLAKNIFRKPQRQK